MSFDWRTDEDERRSSQDWDAPATTEKNQARSRRPPWRLLGLIGVLILLAGGLVWWRVQQRIEAATQLVRSDVIASHNLVQRAAEEGDEELFRSFLSGRNPAWTAGELTLFRNRMLADRSAFGLTPPEGTLPVILPLPGEEAAAGQSVANVELSPDLNEAVLSVLIPYETENAGTVVLEQTTVYRRGDQRWLLSPPADEFWGDWLTSEGDYLSLIYPRRDEAIAGRLATDLDALIDRLCTTLVEIECSADLYMTVRLSENPAVLAALSEPFGSLDRARERGDILELPTPTLVGLPPADEASRSSEAYRALLDGYARQVLGATMARVVGWECCEDAFLFQVLQEYQLSRLGIGTWPVTPAEFRRVLDERIRLSDITSFWRSIPAETMQEDQRWQVYTAMDFFLNATPIISAADLQRALARSRERPRFASELFLSQADLGPAAWIPASLNQAWWLYAISAGLSPVESLVKGTTEELFLVCTSAEDNSSDSSRLLEYDKERSLWNELYEVDGFIWMSALPRPNMMLLQEYSWQTQRWQTGIWQNGNLFSAYDSETEYTISFGETDPGGDKMVTYAFDLDEGGARALTTDLTTCDGNCTSSELPGLPTWSPDGSKAIYVGRGAWLADTTTLFNANGRYVLASSSGRFIEQPLSLGSGDASGRSGFMELDTGYSPFWLDNETYGFIQESGSVFPGPRGEQQVVVATLSDPARRTLITEGDLLQFLPDGRFPRRLTLAYVATHVRQPGKLFVVALDEFEKQAYVFLYDLDSGRIEFRLDMSYNLNHSLGFSPDGRYLVMTGQDDRPVSASDNSGILLLHDIAANRTIPFQTRLPFFLPSVVYDWSNDSRLLAVALDDNLVGVIDLETNAVEVLPHNYGACTSVAWLQS